MSTKTRQIMSDTHTDRGGGNAVLSDSLGALRSLRLSSSSLYLIWAEGWNLVIPPNEQKIVPRTHRDGEGLSSTLCCWHFCPCSGFRGRDKGELGDRENVQGHSHPSHLGRMCPPPACFSPVRRPADSERGLLMRVKLAHRDSQLIAKVAVVTRAYTETSERNVVLRQMRMIRRHTGRNAMKRQKWEFNNLLSTFTH